jgi:hypothetical protein
LIAAGVLMLVVATLRGVLAVLLYGWPGGVYLVAMLLELVSYVSFGVICLVQARRQRRKWLVAPLSCLALSWGIYVGLDWELSRRFSLNNSALDYLLTGAQALGTVALVALVCVWWSAAKGGPGAIRWAVALAATVVGTEALGGIYYLSQAIGGVSLGYYSIGLPMAQIVPDLLVPVALLMAALGLRSAGKPRAAAPGAPTAGPWAQSPPYPPQPYPPQGYPGQL